MKPCEIFMSMEKYEGLPIYSSSFMYQMNVNYGALLPCFDRKIMRKTFLKRW